jgi:transcriptional regulator with GAF, ATPase, and Fis domain
MSACLKVVRGTGTAAEFPLNRTGENLIGRGSQCCIPIADLRVSLVHSKILFSKGHWSLLDCGSVDGTWVNGSRIESWVLISGDRIRIGETEFLLVDTQHANGLHHATTTPDFNELIGKSNSMMELKKRIARIAKASGCILVRGESGTGKELVARAIHRNSLRATKPMLSVNCAAIPHDLMDSQLFGHIKGAFTGADHDHIGYFQQANQGTLFLDEVGELNLEGQAKLLRILEGHPFLPVGGTKQVSVDVHVISATNRDLREFVAERRFREDLYYRLSVFEVEIPPLRKRGEDIELLVGFYLERFKKLSARDHLGMSPEAMLLLRNYDWPGNVRELRNVIDSAVVLAEDWLIRPEDLSLRNGNRSTIHSLMIRIDPPSRESGHPSSSSLRPPFGSSDTAIGGLQADADRGETSPSQQDSKILQPNQSSEGIEFDTLNVSVWEQRLIKEALHRTHGNIPAAAELLGMARATLYRKLEKGFPTSTESRTDRS